MVAERGEPVPTLAVAFGAGRPVIEATEFAIFWKDQFGVIHFFARDDEWWSKWFVEHEFDEVLPVAEHGPQGEIEGIT